jgi:GMP synthase (glutamine-hydrolysing)
MVYGQAYKVLVINNYRPTDRGALRLSMLGRSLGKIGVEYQMRPFGELSEAGKFDAFILTGSSHDLRKDETTALFQDEIELVRTTGKPVLGICYGHQLIGRAFGLKVSPMAARESGRARLQVKPFELFGGGEMAVEQNHGREIAYSPDVEDYFDVLAGSQNCKVEVIRHKQRPIFGVQFHPDTRFADLRAGGEELLRKFTGLASRSA